MLKLRQNLIDWRIAKQNQELIQVLIKQQMN